MPSQYSEMNWTHELIIVLLVMYLLLPDGFKGIYRSVIRASGIQRNPVHLYVRSAVQLLCYTFVYNAGLSSLLWARLASEAVLSFYYLRVIRKSDFKALAIQQQIKHIIYLPLYN